MNIRIENAESLPGQPPQATLTLDCALTPDAVQALVERPSLAGVQVIGEWTCTGSIAYALVVDDVTLVPRLRALGHEVDDDDYYPPTPEGQRQAAKRWAFPARYATVESGRTSCKDLNLSNAPRTAGPRPVPTFFNQIDYAALEQRTAALAAQRLGAKAAAVLAVTAMIRALQAALDKGPLRDCFVLGGEWHGYRVRVPHDAARGRTIARGTDLKHAALCLSRTGALVLLCWPMAASKPLALPFTAATDVLAEDTDDVARTVQLAVTRHLAALQTRGAQFDELRQLATTLAGALTPRAATVDKEEA